MHQQLFRQRKADGAPALYWRHRVKRGDATEPLLAAQRSGKF
ncbi:hypothetical protein Pcaca04_33550 [Pectobacterium carotovorum subsp. carotovorum]|nr:hypothetical protein Pcaca04_33550 [Pectobacterium carotovorum subsp. carotovorum]